MVTLPHLHSSLVLDVGSGCGDFLDPPGPLEQQIHISLDLELLVLKGRAQEVRSQSSVSQGPQMLSLRARSDEQATLLGLNCCEDFQDGFYLRLPWAEGSEKHFSLKNSRRDHSTPKPRW